MCAISRSGVIRPNYSTMGYLRPGTGPMVHLLSTRGHLDDGSPRKPACRIAARSLSLRSQTTVDSRSSPSHRLAKRSSSQSSSRFRRAALSQRCSWRVGSSTAPQRRSRSNRLRIAQQTAARPASRRHPTNTQTTRPASCMGFCRINRNTTAASARRPRSRSTRKRAWWSARNAGKY